MGVKASQSAMRVLAVFEAIATHQPVGVSALAEALQENRSAVQRAVTTLSEAGWIRPASDAVARWELSAHVFAFAHLPHSTESLRDRARDVLDRLRDTTGETAFLAIPEGHRFVVVESAESPSMLRLAPRIGQVIPVVGSATSRALLPYLAPDRQSAMLGRSPNPDELRMFKAARDAGYAVSVGDVFDGATNLAAAILDEKAQPIGALVVSGPTDRLTASRHGEIGRQLAGDAASLSRPQRS